MERFVFSKCEVEITNTVIKINRRVSISGLVKGASMGNMCIKRSSITGVIALGSYITILASGLPSPRDMSFGDASNVIELPNTVVMSLTGSDEDAGRRLYSAICNIIEGTYVAPEPKYGYQEPPVAEVTPVAEVRMWSCGCGTKNKMGSLYCSNCGKYR